MGLFDKIFGRNKKTKTGTETHKPESMNPGDIWYTLPTISNEFPQLISSTKETAFDIHIHEDDYRQNEFLKAASLPLIEQEIVGIKNVWENFSKKSGEYTLFKNCHVRSIIGDSDLKLNLNEFKGLLNIDSMGTVKINNQTLVDSFACRTENTAYYGTMTNGIVTQLCIFEWNEQSATEIFKINKAFNVVFINWYHCDLITENA